MKGTYLAEEIPSRATAAGLRWPVGGCLISGQHAENIVGAAGRIAKEGSHAGSLRSRESCGCGLSRFGAVSTEQRLYGFGHIGSRTREGAHRRYRRSSSSSTAECVGSRTGAPYVYRGDDNGRNKVS